MYYTKSKSSIKFRNGDGAIGKYGVPLISDHIPIEYI